MSTTTTADIPPATLGQGAGAQGAPGSASAGEEAREQGRELARSVTEHGRTLVDQTRSQLRTQADEQGRRLATGLRSVGEDLRSMGEASDDRSPAGEMVRNLGDLAQRWAGRLEQEGVGGIGHELSSLGRRRPLAFLSTSLGLGFLAGRMARNVDTDRIKQAAQGSQGGASSPATASPQAGRPAPTSTGTGTAGVVSSSGSPGSSDPLAEEQTNGMAGPQ